MDEQLVRQLTRQIKIFNIWLMTLTAVFLIGFIVLAILLFKVISFVNDTRNKIDDVQQKASNTLNIQKRVCDKDNSFLQDKLCK